MLPELIEKSRIRLAPLLRNGERPITHCINRAAVGPNISREEATAGLKEIVENIEAEGAWKDVRVIQDAYYMGNRVSWMVTVVGIPAQKSPRPEQG